MKTYILMLLFLLTATACSDPPPKSDPQMASAEALAAGDNADERLLNNEAFAENTRGGDQARL